MATSSQHIRKRQFQPSNQTTLNSYFNRNADNSPLERFRSPMSPPLDAETEAGLISVGMRVRKSVPEGYKTHKTLGQPGFPFQSSAPPASTAPARPSVSPMRSNELQPFCGLHKTGGWAAQEIPSSSAPSILRGQEEDDDMPDLSTSQNTITSTQNSFASRMESKKRMLEDGYEDDAEDAMDNFFDEMDDDATQNCTSRPIARMKASGRKTVSNPHIRVFGDGNDFDEAPFLMPR